MYSPEPDRKRSHRDMLANITLPNVEEMTLDRETRLLAPCNIDQFHTRSQRATARSTVARGETSNAADCRDHVADSAAPPADGAIPFPHAGRNRL